MAETKTPMAAPSQRTRSGSRPVEARWAQGSDRSRSDRLLALVDLMHAIALQLDVDDIAHCVLLGALQVIPRADAGKLLLYDKRLGRLVVQDMIGMAPDAYHLELEPGEGMSGIVLAAQKPMHFPDPDAIAATLQTDRLREVLGTVRGLDIAKSGLAAPLIYRGEPIGVLTVQSVRAANVFDEFDLSLLDSIAKAAASAIAHARVVHAEHEARASLEALHSETTNERDGLQRRLAVQQALSAMMRQGPSFVPLAGQVRSLTGAAAIILDPLYRVRASDPTPSRSHPLEGSTGRRLRDLLRRSARTRATQLVPRSGGASSLVVAPVLSGHELLGFVALEVADRDADPLDSWTADSAAVVAVVPFLAERTREEIEARRLDLALTRLLDGGADGARAVPGRLEPPLFIAVGGFVGFGSDAITEAELDLLARAARETTAGGRSGAMTTVHQRQVVVLSPCGDSDNDASALSVQLESVAARIKGLDASWQVSFAVSDRVDSFDAVPAAFNEARLALEVGRSIGREAAVFRVGGLGAYRFILQATTATQAMAFRDAVLGPVERHDAGQGAQLLHTLLVYIRHGMSVKGTAAALAVHPHTVQYRLRRLEDLTNLDLSRAEDRLTLELAARLHNLAQD